MIIRPRLEIPAMLRRSLEAFRAGDPVTLAEFFETDAGFSMQIDPKIARKLALPNPNAPLVTKGALNIMGLYAAEFDAFEILHLDVLSAMQVGRDVAAVCEWSLKMRSTDITLVGQCHNIWTMDHTGRKCVEAKSVCKILTPDWDHKLN